MTDVKPLPFSERRALNRGRIWGDDEARRQICAKDTSDEKRNWERFWRGREWGRRGRRRGRGRDDSESDGRFAAAGRTDRADTYDR